jgi:hypothetical protein
MSGESPGIRSVKEQIRSRETAPDQQNQHVADSTAAMHAKARSTLAIMVIVIYGAVLATILGVMVFDVGSGRRFDVFYDRVFELLKIGVIPIVTYVLGYYAAQHAR